MKIRVVKILLITFLVLLLGSGCLSEPKVKSKGISMKLDEGNTSDSTNVKVGVLEFYVK